VLARCARDVARPAGLAGLARLARSLARSTNLRNLPGRRPVQIFKQLDRQHHTLSPAEICKFSQSDPDAYECRRGGTGGGVVGDLFSTCERPLHTHDSIVNDLADDPNEKAALATFLAGKLQRSQTSASSS
jgi:hypothetical protein